MPLSNIDVAILVGGLGTRLRGLVDNVPKPLAPVLGRPFLFYLLDMLALRGARSVTLCSGYMAGFVKEKTGTEWLGMPIHHSVENEPMGTAGALALARNYSFDTNAALSCDERRKNYPARSGLHSP